MNIQGQIGVANLDDLGKTPPMVSFLNGLGAVGLGSPVTRVIVSFGLISGLMYLLQPRYSFDDSGSPRPFALFSSEGDATYLPWFLPGVIVALFFGFFI